jgi:hypothetical protein
MELGADHGLPISIDLQAVRAAWGKVIETKGVGNGCTLIRRRVLEALEFKWSPGEFGCCDWHLAVDCQRLGFTQKHDMGVVCGHIAVNPVHRILWPDPEAKGLYRQEVLEKWPDLPRPMEDKQQTGVDHSRDPAPGSQMKVIVRKHFHLGGGVYRSPGEEIDLPVEMARNLLRRRLVKRPGDEEPGWTLKEPCGGCNKARAEA